MDTIKVYETLPRNAGNGAQAGIVADCDVLRAMAHHLRIAAERYSEHMTTLDKVESEQRETGGQIGVAVGAKMVRDQFQRQADEATAMADAIDEAIG